MAIALFCTFHLPLLRTYWVFFGVVVINSKIFLQIIPFKTGFFPFQQFVTLNSRDILIFEFS